MYDEAGERGIHVKHSPIANVESESSNHRLPRSRLHH